MKCPHCRVEIHPGGGLKVQLGNGGCGKVTFNGVKAPLLWACKLMECPACERAIIELDAGAVITGNYSTVFELTAYPRVTERPPAPTEVPPDLAEDFDEAGAVLTLSPKASAALSRRCLQGLLRSQGFNQKDLAPAIDALLATKALPSYLADNLDAVRNVGNFAAHPMKDKVSGAILPVEASEAEWNLDVLEGLFDFYFVQPARDAKRVAALNAKLAAAGKPPIKPGPP